MIDKAIFYYTLPKKRPQEGDRKIKNGKVLIRKQVRTKDGCYLVNNGRPVFEWVEHD